MLTDTQWGRLEPLVEQCRPKGKTPPQDLRRTLSAIVWRHQNGAKWRAIPAELGPWSRAAQTFIRWARLGVWERLRPCCTDQGCGRSDPNPVLGSCDADGLRASQLHHAVEDVDGDVHLGRPTLVRVRSQPVSDHALEP